MTISLIRSYTDKPWRSPETYDLIESSLSEAWPVVSLSPRDGAELSRRLEDLRRGSELFVFNIAEYLDEVSKEGFLPGLLDDLGVPHLGSSAACCAIALDKGRTKAALSAAGVPTPRFVVVEPGTAVPLDAAGALGYPLFVKPLSEGGHIGIGSDSIVRSPRDLERKLRSVFDLTGGAALVEEYIHEEGMREFSVAVLDRPGPEGRGERVFAPIEIDWAAMTVDSPILSYEVAMKDLERVIPVADREARETLSELAGRTFDAVGASDYSRVDIRMNRTGWYVLEINTMPGLGPHSFLPGAVRDQHGLDYPALIRRLVRDSMARQGLSG